MDEIDVYEKMSAIAETPQFSMIFGTENEQSRLIAEHKNWLKEIRHERPNPGAHFKVGISCPAWRPFCLPPEGASNWKSLNSTVPLVKVAWRLSIW